MSTKTTFQFDADKFLRDFNVIVMKIVPEKAKKGMTEAGWQMKLDGDNIEPKAPHATGHMKKQGKVIKAGINKSGDALEVEVGYDTEYAGDLHDKEEGTAFKKPGTGSQWLSSKVDKYKDKYIKIIAEEIK